MKDVILRMIAIAKHKLATNKQSFFQHAFDEYIAADFCSPLFFCGDAADILRQLPSDSIDFAMTSPPYWGHRHYDNGGIGQEKLWEEYVEKLLALFAELKRVLKPTGSFWLNMGDSYVDKCLAGLPWRIALAMVDKQGWILRNDIIWNKIKGAPDNAADKLRNVHEYVFHFVKERKGYYYNTDAIRTKPGQAKVVNGAIVSASGVSGVRYKRQVELSTVLSDIEKSAAFNDLEALLSEVRQGKISDFRMVIRGQQRTTHSDSIQVSGRAKELTQRGYYFLKYHPNGSKPADVWDIIPEDTQNRTTHFAPYPADLCKIPILATCPPEGIVLDPFCGTGTTMSVAQSLFRKSIGIDIATSYLEIAEERCRVLL